MSGHNPAQKFIWCPQAKMLTPWIPQGPPTVSACTKDRIIVANGPTGRNHEWYECGVCGKVTLDKATMDSHRLKEARCHRFDINAKPFYSKEAKAAQAKAQIQANVEARALEMLAQRHLKTLSNSALLQEADKVLEDIANGDLYEGPRMCTRD